MTPTAYRFLWISIVPQNPINRQLNRWRTPLSLFRLGTQVTDTSGTPAATTTTTYHHYCQYYGRACVIGEISQRQCQYLRGCCMTVCGQTLAHTTLQMDCCVALFSNKWSMEHDGYTPRYDEISLTQGNMRSQTTGVIRTPLAHLLHEYCCAAV